MAATSERQEAADSPFLLAEWLVEPRLNRMTRGEESVQIELKMMDVLVCLAGRGGDVVDSLARDDLATIELLSSCHLGAIIWQQTWNMDRNR